MVEAENVEEGVKVRLGREVKPGADAAAQSVDSEVR